ncbi:MAG TPA: universal stress protein [Polyangiaceae bacterium]|nr:universal stress protein [Polyangiaceae bacterium]
MQLLEGAPSIERVLCALDVEHPIVGALSFAGLIATRFGVPLEVLHVEAGRSPWSFQNRANRVAELMASHNVGQLLDRLVSGRGEPESTTTTRLASGSPVTGILERTAVSGNELIVLGARQRSDLGWQFRDDIARQVSALAQCATLTVHDRDRADKIERILVPIDFGAVTDSAVAWALLFAQRFAAEVHILHVVSRAQRSERHVEGARKNTPSSRVPPHVSSRGGELAAGLVSAGVRATSDVVIAGSIVNGIANYSDRGEFDLLVLGLTGPPRGAARLTRGLAATLRNRLSIPLLSIRQATVDPPNAASGTAGR